MIADMVQLRQQPEELRIAVIRLLREAHVDVRLVCSLYGISEDRYYAVVLS